MIGQTLNHRYTLTALLGKGAMGQVYRAADAQTGAAVAVKVIVRDLAFDPEMLERFRREGEALRQLRHPNIVGFVDMFEHAGQQIIVMEHVPGGSLHDLIKQGPLPIERARRIALELCDALTRAHHLNIIHRDIKPENVLLAEDGTPRLTDFGVARLVKEVRLTGQGTQVGTPSYMSPEAWAGQPLDAQADVWSLGVVLYEMLTGEVPFGGDTLMAVMNRVLNAPLPDVQQLRPDVPVEMVNLLGRMLARDREQRYTSMRQVAADLAHGAAPPPTVTAPMPTAVSARPARRRIPAWLLGAAAVVVPGWVLAAVGAVALLVIGLVAGMVFGPGLVTPVPTATATPVAGETRVSTGEFLAKVLVSALAIDPRRSSTIFAGTYGAGIYVSEDGGQTWTARNIGLGKGMVGQIAIDSNDSNVMYAALSDQGGVYKSIDGGQTWQAMNTGINLDGAWPWLAQIYIHPADSQRLYYSGVTNGFYLSVDGGQTWRPPSASCPMVTDLVMDPVNPDHLYAGSDECVTCNCPGGGVYETTDGGLTWKPLIPPEMVVPLTDRALDDIWHVAADPHDLNTLYAGGWTATLKSLDGGRTWFQILGENCQRLLTNPQDGAVYCVQAGQAQISRDGGVSWELMLGTGWGLQNTWFSNPLVIRHDDQRTLYTGGNGVMKSTDGGLTWQLLNWPVAARVHIMADPRNGQRLFLNGGDSWEVYRSTDGGKIWQPNDIGGGRPAFDPARGLIYLFGDGAYRSHDDGLTWERFGSGYPEGGGQLAPDLQNAGRLWLLNGCFNRPFLSTDGGATFAAVASFPKEVCGGLNLLVHPDGKRIYVMEWGSFFRSADGGQTWLALDSPGGFYWAAAVDPTDPDVVYLGTTNKGVWKTINGGQTWTPANTGLAAIAINDLVVDAANPQKVYAATDGGAFVSLDGGGNWRRIQDSLRLNPIVYSIALDPNDASRIYAATPDGIIEWIQP